MAEITNATSPHNPATPSLRKNDALMAAARELEGAFLSEMLKSAGFAEARSAFGGGVGEEQFSSLLRDMHSRELAQNGGIGLAEAIYRSMMEAQDGQ